MSKKETIRQFDHTQQDWYRNLPDDLKAYYDSIPEEITLGDDESEVAVMNGTANS